MAVTKHASSPRRAEWVGRQCVTALAPDFGGEMLRPRDDGFEAAARLWNGTIKSRPALILRPRTAQDVAAAVRTASQINVPVAVRGGGHNVAGLATCDEGVVIDLTAMNWVASDPGRRRVRAGGGATWGDVDRSTQRDGLAVPGGLVSKTGVAGLTLGGGLGWMRRKFGLSCDSLISVEIVTADGEVRRASEIENPDLFWALCGGGGNFGVVTEFEFRLHPIGPEVMFALVFYPIEDGREVLKSWREFCASCPDDVSSLALCGTVPTGDPFPPATGGRAYVAIGAVHSGSPQEGKAVLQPLRELGAPLCDLSAVTPYVDVQTAFDEDYPDGRRYYWKSLYLNGFDDEAIELVLDLTASRPSPLTTVDVWQLGGAMTRIAPDATAFGNRGAPFLLGVESNWVDPDNDEENRVWTREACSKMARFSTGLSYLNFEPEPVSISRVGNSRSKLGALKQRYDPRNLFRFNHRI